MRTCGILALLAAPMVAEAFCGTYVGGADGALTNHYSRIVVARAGTLTTLTMINDVEGDLAEFGLVIPIPEAIDDNDVRLADRELIDRIDQYSAPRVVEYSCEDFYAGPDVNASTPNPAAQSTTPTGSSGCGGTTWGGDGDDTADGWTDTATGVDVEDHFELGEYEAFVLSSEGSDGLLAWLQANGFAVDGETSALFQEYIDADNRFLALKVNLEEVPAERGWLTPLQIRYNSEAFGLPIRMGARSSEGVQDLVVFAITEPAKGRVAVSNYPEQAVSSECLVHLDPVDVEGATFSEFYEANWSDTTGIYDDPERARGNPGLAWNTEYSWGAGKCDPCDAGGPLTTDEVQALGYDDAFYGFHLTRLHLRYTPDAVTQDLVFYESGISTPSQMRYVKHKWELESLFPTCGAEQPETPGTCFGSEYWARRAQGLDEEPLVHDDSYTFLGPLSGCQTPGRALLALPLLLAWRRRRKAV